MKVYIAGPMTGLPHFNFPAFDEAAEALRAIGWDVVSPAELDSPEHRVAAYGSPDGDPASYGAATGETWGDLLARDVKLIADDGIEAIVVLPGWERSRGARLETYVGAALHGLPVYRMPGGSLHLARFERVPAGELARAWATGEAAPEHHGFAVDLDPKPSDADDVRDHPAARSEVRVTNETTGGQKGSKPQRMALLPWDALPLVSEVYGFGARKYEPNNWRKGYDWSLSFDALQRHLASFWSGEDTDPESGLPHLAHAAFHVLGLLVFSTQARYADLDDRPGSEVEG